MKRKLTVAIDEKLVPKAKEYARSEGVSLSQLVETSLRDVVEEEEGSFVDRWRGKFQVPDSFDPDEELYKALVKKYL